MSGHIFLRIGAIIIGTIFILFRKILAQGMYERYQTKNYPPEGLYFAMAIFVFAGLMLIILGVTGQTHWGSGNPNFAP